MTPQKINVAIYQGSVFERTITFQNPDESAVDLTGYTGFRLQVRSDYVSEGGTLYCEATEGNGLTITSATGTIAIQLTAEKTALCVSKLCKWDFQWTRPDGQEETPLYGKATVTLEVTRA
jgi:hypothetical protein